MANSIEEHLVDELSDHAAAKAFDTLVTVAETAPPELGGLVLVHSLAKTAALIVTSIDKPYLVKVKDIFGEELVRGIVKYG